MKDANIIPPDAKVHLTKRGREKLLAQAEAEFDAVTGELQSKRRQYVAEGDFESLARLASNLLVET